MSTTPLDLGGYNMKEWSMIILLVGLAIVFVVFGIGMAIGIANADIAFTGEIDLGQFTGIIIGIAMTAVVLVGQQLATKATAIATKQADDAWIANP